MKMEQSAPKRRHIKGTYLAMNMEQCSETSAYKRYLPDYEYGTAREWSETSEYKGYLPAYENGTESVPKRRHIKGTYLPMRMEECSETSAYKIQTPGNYPEESAQHSEHGESLKSRVLQKCLNKSRQS